MSHAEFTSPKDSSQASGLVQELATQLASDIGSSAGGLSLNEGSVLPQDAESAPESSTVEDDLNTAMQQLSVSGSSRGRPSSQRNPQSAGLPWRPPSSATPYQLDNYGNVRMAPRHMPGPIQWMPYHPSMGYGMYGDPRAPLYFDSRLQQHGFYAMNNPYFPPPPPPQYPGQRFNDIMPGYYAQQQRQVTPTIRQRPPRPTKLSHESSDTFDFDVEEAEQRPDLCRKTLMLRNIPNKYSIHMLLEMLNTCHRQGPSELVYDFCYLPIDFKNRCNLGYAFVNFVDARSTLECYRAFHEKRWNDFNSKKVCEVKYGRVQGRAALIEHFKNSKFPSNDIDSLPLLFEQVVKEDGTKEVVSVPLHSRQPS